MPQKPRVAIVHDWLVGGGAERVVENLHQLYPDAPIYTSYATDEWRMRLDDKVVTGWLQHLGPLRKFIPFLRILWVTRLDLSGYDLVISSTGNGEAKGIHTSRGTTHICYCHAPVHFYWGHYEQYLREPGFGILNPVVRLGLRLLVGPLRRWDLKASQRPDYFIANSSHTAAEVKKFYGRDAVVVHPPVDTRRFKTSNRKRSGFVTAGRLVPQKQVSLIVQACTELELPLTVIGRGPERDTLRSLAGPTVTIRDDVSDEEMPKLLAGADAFIFAAYDDFGITPVEAMAAGTPVIAYHAGGALDYVVPNKTGMFFPAQTVDSLKEALVAFKAADYDHTLVAKHAQSFSTEAFRTNIKTVISEHV
ncbi:glycosyltransferase [Candidatus Saccharibacteria bacterium]|nr:glycosyltransferase [Candidatus Saccharibacteria bacterium]